MSILLIRLEGPLQSWGDHSHWDERDSSTTPTKSGMVGLLGNCLGLGRDAPEISLLYEMMRVSVRVDDPGQYMKDFQTISHTRTAEGKMNPNMVISPHQYLLSASFLVAIEVMDPIFSEKLVQAVKQPLRPPYLGRKCCIPTIPLFVGFVPEGNVLGILEQPTFPIRHYGSPPIAVRLEVEGEAQRDEPLYRRRDVLGTLRTFRYRTCYGRLIQTKNMAFQTIGEDAYKEGEYVSGTN